MALYVRYQPFALGGGGGGGGGSMTMGAFDDETGAAEGATIIGSILYMQSATQTVPGLVNTGAQTFGGAKTIMGNDPAAVQLIVMADPAQSNNIFEVWDSAGAPQFFIADGSWQALGDLYFEAGGASYIEMDPTEVQVNGTSFDFNTGDVSVSGNISAGNLSGTNLGDVTLAAVGATPNANAASLSGQILNLQPADATFPGVVTAIAQTFAGNKTFNSAIYAPGGVDLSSPGTLAIGTSANATVINIGNSGATVNINGTVLYENVTQLQVADPAITINVGGGAGSASNSGIEIEEASVITGYAETSADRNSWIFKAPNTAGIATITPGAGGITISQSSHDPVTLAAFGSTPNANGASLSSQALTLQPADASFPGGVSTTTQTFAGAKTFNTSALSPIFSSTTANPASAGVLRLANTDSIAWRDSTNAANLTFTPTTFTIHGATSESIQANAPILTTSFLGGGAVFAGDVSPAPAAPVVSGSTVSSPYYSYVSGASPTYEYFGARYQTGTTGASLALFKARGALNAPTVVVSGDNLGSFTGYGYDGTDFEAAASILIQSDGTPGSNDMPGRIVFQTTPDGSATPVTALTLNSSQNAVFVGTLSSGAAAGTTGQLNLVGSISGTVGVKVANAAGTWTLTLPTDDGTAGQYLKTDGAGITSWDTPAGNLTIDRFSGNGSTTGFTLSVAPGTENNTWVYISGVYQQKDTYSVSGTTLTFSTAPPSGTDNIEVVIGSSLSIGTPSDGTVTYAKLASGVFVAPTIQKFTTGSGTYTTPTSPRAPLYIKVRMVGGGGGGGSSGSTSGTASTNGGASSFSGSGVTLTANGGARGQDDNNGGTGGTASISGAIGTALSGGSGGGSGRQGSSPVTSIPGGIGGSSFFSGGGYGGSTGSTGTGQTAPANTGSGGGGGQASAVTNVNSGSGGGAGGYVEAIISSAAATYSYSVGTAGNGQAAGSSGQAGGDGSAGYIEVTEYYQ